MLAVLSLCSTLLLTLVPRACSTQTRLEMEKTFWGAPSKGKAHVVELVCSAQGRGAVAEPHAAAW